MPSLYTFLHDEAELAAFVDAVVPDLEDDEALILQLMARRKYLREDEQRELSLGSAVVFRREVITRKERVVSRVQRLSVERGLYTDREGRGLPEHAFGVYLTLNPRSQRKAAVATIKELADRLYEGQPVRLHQTALSQLHKAPARKPLLDFDVDLADGDDLDATVRDVRAALGTTPVHVVETRGGAHVAVPTQEIDRAVKKTFYRDVMEIGRRLAGGIEVHANGMIPLPGTSHGGTVVRMRRGPSDESVG